MATELGKAYIQIIPSAEGISGSISSLLGDEIAEASSFGDKAKSTLGAIGGVIGDALMSGAKAATGFAKESVNAGMTFDASMSQVAATMGYTVQELNTESSEAAKTFNMLRNFAMEMGSETAFSATQSADALNYMALAGYTAEQSVDMLPNVLNLAAAGSMDLARASDMVTDSQSALGLTFEETTQLVDMMAKASSKSNTSVAQLGDAILTVGGTAKNLSGGTTELNTALGILANNGIKGAEGGTALRNVILSLSAPTGKASATMAALGLEVFDTAGNMRPLNETFSDLNGILSDMTQGEQIQVLNTIFNKVDLKSVNALLAGTATEFENIGTALKNSGVEWDGYITEIQERTGDASLGVNDFLQDITNFLNGMTDAGYTAVEQQEVLQSEFGLTEEDARTLVEAFQTSFANQQAAFEKATTAVKNSGIEWEKYGDAVWSVDGMLDEVIWNLTEAGTTAEELQDYLVMEYEIGADDALLIVQTMSENLSSQTSIWDDLEAEINDATGAAQAMADTQLDNLAGDITLFQSALEGAQITISDELTPTLREFVQFGTDAVSTLTTAFQEGGLSGAMEALGTIISNFITMVIEHLPEIVEAGMKLLEAFVQGIVENLPQIMEAAVQIILILATGIGNNLPTIIPSVVGIVVQIATTLLEHIPELAEAGLQLIIGLATGLVRAIPELIRAIPQIIESLIKNIIEAAPMMLTAALELIIQLGIGLVEAVPEILALIPEIIIAIVQGFIEGIPQMLETGKQLLEGLWQGLIEGVTWLITKIGEIVDHIVQGFKDLFGIHSPSTVFAELGGFLIEGLLQGITDAWHSILDFFQGAWEGIKEIFANVGEWFSERFESARAGIETAWNAVGDFFSGIWEGIKGVFQGVVEFFSGLFSSAAEAVSHAWDGVVTFFGNVWDGISKAFDHVVEFFSGVFSDAWEGIKKVWDGVKEFFSGIWEGITGTFAGVVEFFSGIFTDAWNAIQEVWNGVSEFFSGVWKGITELFGQAAEFFGGIFTEAWETIQSVWDGAVEFFSGLWDGITKIFAGVVEFFSGIFHDAWDAITQVFDGVVEFFSGVWESIQGVFVNVAEWFRSKFDEARQKVEEVWRNVTAVFEQAWTNIQGVFKDVGEWFKTKFESARDKAVAAWDNIKSKFSTVWSNIKSAFKISDALQWGKDMIKNFISGITSMISNVRQAVGKVADAIRDFIGFSEPDKGPLSNFHTFAPDMMKLFAEGIRENESLITDQIEKSFDFGTRTIDFSVSGSGQMRPEFVNASGYGRGGDTYNFYSPKAIDEVEAVRRLKKARQQMAMAY